MLNLKQNTLVKAVGIIVLSAVVWTIGYLSGLEIGQKKAEQNFSQQRQNENNQRAAQLPKIPNVPDNQNTGLSDQLPAIPQIK